MADPAFRLLPLILAVGLSILSSAPAGTQYDDRPREEQPPEAYEEPFPEERPQRRLEPARYVVRLLDDFEKIPPWSNDSADDHAALSLSTDTATSGRASLRVDFRDYGRGKFQIRRDGRLDLSDADRLMLDVFNAGKAMRIALGLAVDRTGKYYESPRVALEPGWNRDVTFSLGRGGFSLGDEDYRRVPADLDDVAKLCLVFYEDENAEGTVYVDNLRVLGPEAAAASQPPAILSMKASAAALLSFDRFELELDINGSYQDFFDRDDIDLWATLYSPSGRRFVVHGFYDGLRPEGSPPRPVWRIRFAPNEGGRWLYDVTVRNAYGETVSPLAAFAVESAPRRRGFVRVSRRDPQFFEFDNGEFYYPVGQNVAWATNMKHYFEAIRSYGGNVVRVWLAPWHLEPELRREPGRYDIETARRIDALLEMAEAYDVYVILVLHYHGILRESWPQSPYNAANGGPCARPEAFFTNSQARALVGRKLDYIGARYGFSTRIFAWELFNEADLAAYTRFEDVVAWHAEMARRLRAADPCAHLITTSLATHSAWRSALYALPEIDFVAAHVYGPDLGPRIDQTERQLRLLNKPVFLGECGGFTTAADERADAEGVYLHAGLWYSFITPWAGAALPWWWDAHIEADNLYHHLRALARFARGEDRRGHRFQTVESSLPTGRDTRADVRGILAPELAYLWIHDAARMSDARQPARPVVHGPAVLRLDGMVGGVFIVDVWDAWTGERLSRVEVRSADGRLDVAVPASRNDLAVKVKRRGAGGPRIVPGP